jgi:hypothetical protein
MIQSGTSADTSSGDIVVKSANGGAAGVSGMLTIGTGTSSIGGTGSLNLATGYSRFGSGGEIDVRVGSGESGEGGNLNLQAGNSADEASGGSIRFTSGTRSICLRCVRKS